MGSSVSRESGFLLKNFFQEWARWERMLAGPMGRVSISFDVMESVDELSSIDSGVVVLSSKRDDGYDKKMVWCDHSDDDDHPRVSLLLSDSPL